jgi:UrcA family protein
MRTSFIALAAAAAAVFAVPAAAQETVTITVQTHDLDLTDSADQSRLDRRVEQAIRRACRSGGRDLASRQVETACRAELADIASPRVELAIANANETRFASLDLTPGA